MHQRVLFALFILLGFSATACAPFWVVSRIEEKVDRLVQNTNRGTLNEIFGGQTEEIMRKVEDLSEAEQESLNTLIADYERGAATLDDVASVVGGREREVSSARGIWVRDEEGARLKPIPRRAKLKNCRRISEDDLPETIAGRKVLMNYNWGVGTLKGETVLFPWDLTMSSFTREIVENTARRTAEEFIKLGGRKAFNRPIRIQISTETADAALKVTSDDAESEIYVDTGDEAGPQEE